MNQAKVEPKKLTKLLEGLTKEELSALKILIMLKLNRQVTRQKLTVVP